MISGQAAIAVVVSVVQVVTSASSVWGSTPEAIAAFISNDGIEDGTAEQDSARFFFWNIRVVYDKHIHGLRLDGGVANLQGHCRYFGTKCQA